MVGIAFQSHSEIIKAFGYKKLAAALRLELGTVRIMKYRDRIPDRYWDEVVEAAKRHRIKGISLAILQRIAKDKKAAA